jgi:hypothetical protein
MVSGQHIVEAARMTTSWIDPAAAGFDRELTRSSAETLHAKRLQMSGPLAPMTRGWAPLQTAMTDALCNPPTRIADVLAIQVTVQAILDQLPPSPANNRVAAFNKLYLTITRRVDVALQTTATNPKFLEMLDVEFAKRYFVALDLWNREQDEKMSELVAAVLGVNAHINHDLALALISTWEQLGPPPDETIYPDYLLVNKIFYEEIQPLRRGFSDDWQMELDRLVGPLDDWSQRILVKVTRAQAWETARGLWPLRDKPAEFEEARRLLDKAASLLGEWMIFGDRVVTDAGDVVTGGWHLLKRLLPAHESHLPHDQSPDDQSPDDHSPDDHSPDDQSPHDHSPDGPRPHR